MPEAFLTDFNRRVYSCLYSRLNEGLSIDLSVFAGEFTPEENGRIAKFVAMKKEISNTLNECYDCIKVLEEEKSKLKSVNPAEASDDEFMNFFRKKSN